MGKILFEHTLEKIPGNSHRQIEENVLRFGRYVDLFGNLPQKDGEISTDCLTVRIYSFYFLYQLFFYVLKSESVNYDREFKLT